MTSTKPVFGVQVGRDARAYFKARISAGSIEEIQANLSRHGLECPDDTQWENDGVDAFDNVETCVIYDPATDEVLAYYSDSEGWNTP